MQSKDYEFSVSVLLPECGLNKKQILDSEAVLQFMRLDRRQDIPGTDSSESLLVGLVRFITGKLGDLAHKDCQTEPDTNLNVHQKLNNIEDRYEHQIAADLIQNQASLEQRMNQYQRECDQRMQAELSTAIANFKENALMKMRENERERHHDDIEKIKAEYEMRTFERKAQLDQLEQETLATLRHKESGFEKTMFADRQKLLNEFDALKVREENMKKEMELNERSTKLAEEKARRKFEDALEKFHEADRVKEEFTIKLQDAIQKHKLQFEHEHNHLIAELREDKSRIDTDQAVVKEKMQQLQFYREQCEKLQRELDLARNSSQLAQTELVILRKENESLKTALTELKNSHAILSSHNMNQTSTLEVEIIGMKRTIADLEKTLKLKEEETTALRRDKSDASAYGHKVRKVALKWQKQAQLLHLRLDSQITENEDMTKKLDDEVIKGRELAREVASLRLLLHHAQSALQNDNVPNQAVYNSENLENVLNLNNMNKKFEPLVLSKYDFARPEPLMVSQTLLNEDYILETKENIFKSMLSTPKALSDDKLMSIDQLEVHEMPVLKQSDIKQPSKQHAEKETTPTAKQNLKDFEQESADVAAPIIEEEYTNDFEVESVDQLVDEEVKSDLNTNEEPLEKLTADPELQDYMRRASEQKTSAELILENDVTDETEKLSISSGHTRTEVDEW